MSRKNWLGWYRPEILTMIGVILLYSVLITVFQADYIVTVLPYILKHYYVNIDSGVLKLMSYPPASYALFSLPFYIYQVRHNSYSYLCNTLFVALLGFLLAYLAQRSIVYYHALPLFSVATLLLSLQFITMAAKQNFGRMDIFFCLLMILLLLIFMFVYARTIWTEIVFAPVAFYLYCASIFACLLLLKNKSFTRIICSVAAIISVCCLVSYLMQHISWYRHVFATVLILMLVLFSLAVGKKYLSNVMLSLLAILLFVYPVYAIKIIFNYEVHYKAVVLNKVLNYVKTNAFNRPIYFLSVSGVYSSEVVGYLENSLPQRYDSLWMLSELMRIGNGMGDNALRTFIQDNSEEYFFVNVIADDLYIHKPSLIFVDEKIQTVLLGHRKLKFTVASLLDYLQNNRKFNQQWRNYQYVETIQDPFNWFKLRVYKRIAHD